MRISFFGLDFEISDGRILLKRCGNITNKNGCGFVEVQICGENKDTNLGAKMANSSEGRRLKYVSHLMTDTTLEIVQRSQLIEAKTHFTAYKDTNAIRIYTEIRNISDGDIVLEEVSAFTVTGIGRRGIDSARELYLTRFTQSHHAECQPRRASFYEMGLFRVKGESQKRIAFANVGSWSTKEALPQGIIEDTENKSFTMFQIESNNSWYYEIADIKEEFYLYLSGANQPFGGWCKRLMPQESYRTVNAAVCFGDSLNGVVGEITKYRRHISGRCDADASLPTIFNEYMHLSWDSPTEENTKMLAPVVAKTGVKYYVIDCGWHNEEDGNKIYPYIGQWRESAARFPHGVRATTDLIRSLGMKAGLWIEPEAVGIYCKDMLEYYDDDCFLQRHGKKLAVMGRHFLDFRAPKVIDYLTETIRRMVEDYGAEYIKFDYNQDCGVGTDYLAICAGEGLEQCANAYLNWVDGIRARFPSVLFETCSSGGMRMDYRTLSHYSIVSTSDQVDYLKYPYIAGNILSAVLPEQAAVWSYPIAIEEIGKPFPYDRKYVKENISDERIAMNMINSFLGRMHLASHLELLTKEQFDLVREGVEYYDSLTEAKKTALPCFPFGFSTWGDERVIAGFQTDTATYLAVWNISDEKGEISIPLNGKATSAEIGYPKSSAAKVTLSENIITVSLKKGSAVFLHVIH